MNFGIEGPAVEPAWSRWHARTSSLTLTLNSLAADPVNFFAMKLPSVRCSRFS